MITTKFNDFYNEFFGLVYLTVSRFCPKDVDDIVADFIEKKILKGTFLTKLLAAENQAALIVTSVGNFCKTQIRLKKQNENFSLDEILPLNLTVENKINEIECSDDFKHILSKLSIGQQAVIEQTIEGYDDFEIAESLKTTINSVRQMRSRARTKIWKLLNQ